VRVALFNAYIKHTPADIIKNKNANARGKTIPLAANIIKNGRLASITEHNTAYVPQNSEKIRLDFLFFTSYSLDKEIKVAARLISGSTTSV